MCAMAHGLLATWPCRVAELYKAWHDTRDQYKRRLRGGIAFRKSLMHDRDLRLYGIIDGSLRSGALGTSRCTRLPPCAWLVWHWLAVMWRPGACCRAPCSVSGPSGSCAVSHGRSVRCRAGACGAQCARPLAVGALGTSRCTRLPPCAWLVRHDGAARRVLPSAM